MLPWCGKCKKACKEKGFINSFCLACKWEYVGKEAFDRKCDLFDDNLDDAEHETPYDYFGDSVNNIGAEAI